MNRLIVVLTAAVVFATVPAADAAPRRSRSAWAAGKLRRVHAGHPEDLRRRHQRNVNSTAGEATLTVHDATGIGIRASGQRQLLSLAAAASERDSSQGVGTALATIGGPDAPLTLLTYSGPVSNDSVTLNFTQNIVANESLRTGTYGKSLTFTLSTTTPVPMSRTATLFVRRRRPQHAALDLGPRRTSERSRRASRATTPPPPPPT